jgi:hypothetical protein
MKFEVEPVSDSEEIKWSDVLCLYFNIQTFLLSKLKYKYLKQSILFFGSYYETMIQVILAFFPHFKL